MKIVQDLPVELIAIGLLIIGTYFIIKSLKKKLYEKIIFIFGIVFSYSVGLYVIILRIGIIKELSSVFFLISFSFLFLGIVIHILLYFIFGTSDQKKQMREGLIRALIVWGIGAILILIMIISFI